MYSIYIYVYFAGITDYSPGPYSVTFPAGTTTASFSIVIIDDNLTEENEQFYLTADPTTLLNDVVIDNLGAAVITIVDNDSKLFINHDKQKHLRCKIPRSSRKHQLAFIHGCD